MPLDDLEHRIADYLNGYIRRTTDNMEKEVDGFNETEVDIAGHDGIQIMILT